MADARDGRQDLDDDESMSDASSEQGDPNAPLGGADEDWDEWNSEDAGDGDGEPSRSLFQPDVVLPSPEAAFAYDKEHHGIDVREYAVQVGAGGMLSAWLHGCVACRARPCRMQPCIAPDHNVDLNSDAVPVLCSMCRQGWGTMMCCVSSTTSVPE
jgi:hypothetical protein